MPNNKPVDQKKPGEHPPGKFHFNPGNMAGKTADICKDEDEQENNKDRIRARKADMKSRSKE